MIQPKNFSLDPSSRPGTNVHPKEQDARLNVHPRNKTQDQTRNIRKERNDELSSHAVFHHNVVHSCESVATRVCYNNQTCSPCDQHCQWDANLNRRRWSCFWCAAMLTSFLFVQNHICFVGETSELETFFWRCCLLCFVPCLRSIWR